MAHEIWQAGHLSWIAVQPSTTFSFAGLNRNSLWLSIHFIKLSSFILFHRSVGSHISSSSFCRVKTVCLDESASKTTSAVAKKTLLGTASHELSILETQDSETAVHKYITTNTHTHPFNSSFSTRVSRYQKGKTIWILLKQETVSGSGISWAICKSAPRSRQITMPAPTTQFFTCRIPSLPPNQQRQSTEGTPQPQETLPLTGTKSYCLVIES